MQYILSLLFIAFSFSSIGQDPMYDICPIKNSESVPEATVYTTEGDSLNLKTHIGERSVVLVFYRGGWCPYCIRHLSALGEIKEQLDSLGFDLIGITPDDYTQLDTSITRSGVVDYELLSDKDIDAINAFGIGWQVSPKLYIKYKTKYKMDLEWWNGTTSHILPVPSVFIIKGGEIQYQHVDPNYSKRLSPEILLSFLKALV